MQLAQPDRPASVQLDEIRQLVSTSLWGDWIIRIEHATADPRPNARWQQWGDALFAVRDTTPVIEAIQACRAAYRTRAIRLTAEKLRPQTRLVYCIQRAGDDQPLVEQPVPGDAPLPAAVAEPEQRPRAQARAAGGALWRYAAVAGTLLGSVLVVEMAIN